MRHTRSKGRKISFLSLRTATAKKFRPFLPATVDLFSSLSAIANLHTILKTFIPTYPNNDKSKYETHSKYILIIKRFQKR